MMNKLKSKPLPYTMGNAGDLIKHGLISEFFEWYLKLFKEKGIIYFDPFGGRPWDSPINPEVKNRLNNLPPCALKSAQNNIDKCYFGSGHIIENIGKIHNIETKVYLSDRDNIAYVDLIDSGLSPITLKGFNSESAYSILGCEFRKTKDTLILIDPFNDLQKINTEFLQMIVDLVLNQKVIVALYVLYKNEEIELWDDFTSLNEKLTKDRLNYHSLLCKKIDNSEIEGESKFNSFISLYMNKSFSNNSQQEKLSKTVLSYAINLSEILSVDVKYQKYLIKV